MSLLTAKTGRVRGFAFVEMETPTQEEAAITALDGAEWMGRTLKVNPAKPVKIKVVDMAAAVAAVAVVTITPQDATKLKNN